MFCCRSNISLISSILTQANHHYHFFSLSPPIFSLPSINITNYNSKKKKEKKKALSTISFSSSSSPSVIDKSKSWQEDNPLVSSLTENQKQKVQLYVDALLQWNQRMNLTAVDSRDEVMKRHVEDSLAILPIIRNDYLVHCSDTDDGLRVVDVGSGAGLPGIMLAIACPAWNVTLLESMQKRCNFLEYIVKHSELENVHVVCGRAELLGQQTGFRESFDVAVARAVADMRILAEYCLPLVRVGGLFLAAKGHSPLDEVEQAQRAINLMGSSVLHVHSVESVGPYGQRTAVVCFKHKSTPRKYPRLPGTPAKTPL